MSSPISNRLFDVVSGAPGDDPPYDSTFSCEENPVPPPPSPSDSMTRGSSANISNSRDPILLVEPGVFNPSEEMKEVCRLGPKFCPTPRAPVDALAIHKSFVNFQESLRWNYFWSTKDAGNNMEQEEFIKFPWTKKTKRKAPLANTAIEYFLEQCQRDLSLRRRIRDNLSVGQRQALKELAILPSRGIRVRTQDKGQRFVFVQSEKENNLVFQDHLLDASFYEELVSDQTQTAVDTIINWACNLRGSDHLSDNIADFISNISDSRATRPKPLYKTHKSRKQEAPYYPARLLMVGCGTPVHPLSKVCQICIQHLVDTLKYRRGNTMEVLDVIENWNHEWSPFPSDTHFIFPDVRNMYPSVNNSEAIDEIRRRLSLEPCPIDGISHSAISEALELCRRLPSISFRNRHFSQISGCAMGPPDSPDFADIWMSGPIASKIINTSPVPIQGFGFYRDDGLGLIKVGDIPAFSDHLNSIHPNLSFDINSGTRGEYLDLFIYMKNGRIETKVYSKPTSSHIYLHPKSCHDPSVFRGIFKGVGQRLRLNTSEDSLLEPTLAEYAGYFADSGYNYNVALRGLRKGAVLVDPEWQPDSSHDPPIISRSEFISKKVRIAKGRRRNFHKGGKAYWVMPYDPRVPRPSEIINKHFDIIRQDPVANSIFPRSKVVGATKRLKNLSELISPTLPKDLRSDSTNHPSFPHDDPPDHPDDPPDHPDNKFGCFKCRKAVLGNSCDFCSHLDETDSVTSVVNGRRFAIRKHLSHDTPHFWFVYLITDTVCMKQYVGSTINLKSRWANHKSDCNSRKSLSTGLAKHFSMGCKGFQKKNQPHLRISIIDGLSTRDKIPVTHNSRLRICPCKLCIKLRHLESTWIFRLDLMNTFAGGLNSKEDDPSSSYPT